MPPTRQRPITTIVSLEDAYEAPTTPAVDARKRPRFSRATAAALPSNPSAAVAVDSAPLLTPEAAPALLNLVQHLVTLEVEGRGLDGEDAIAS